MKPLRHYTLACGLLLSACIAHPQATLRDATILAPTEKRAEFGATAPLDFSSNLTPTLWGGSFDAAIRQGLDNQAEIAARVGLTPYGFYTGIEGAKPLALGEAWNTIGYGGLLWGLDALSLVTRPAHQYAQIYSGAVLGKVQGFFRFEFDARWGLQGGFLSSRPYVDTNVTIEPRLRLAGSALHFLLGLGLDGGLASCSRCTLEADRSRSSLFYWGIRPLVGLSFP